MKVKKYFSNITILLYHEVTDVPERAKKIRKMGPADSLTVGQFEEQMALLSEKAFTRVVTADDIFNKAEDDAKKIVITFDDGFIGNYLFAFDILERYGFKATFFITVDDISKDRYMSWDQLSVLYKNGHSIQSHTMTHPMLGECDVKRITYELETSKKIIEDKIGSPVKYLSLPYGSLNERVIKIAKGVGYKAIFTSSSIIRNWNGEFYQLGRAQVKDTYTLKKFVRLVDPNPVDVLLSRTKEVLKRRIKEIIGLDNYRKLYRLVYRIEL
jgi:peptidoglycan/xylan/chitin deacetylase (PgdA/CDA1 family)